MVKKHDANVSSMHSDTKFAVDEHIEEELDDKGTPVKRKGIYLLPNLLTTGNLFCGFYSILASQAKLFNAACVVIFVAMILDALDGRVARLTNTQSKFGEQYDSLADLATFSIAPAVLAYSWTLHSLGKIGWMIAFIFMACGALRLARFNAQINVVDNKKVFVGLSSPASAGVVTALIWSLNDIGLNGLIPTYIIILTAFIVLSAGILMFSNIRYNSFKSLDLNFSKRVHIVFMLFIVLLFAVVFSDPPKILLLLFISYAVSGPLSALYSLYK